MLRTVGHNSVGGKRPWRRRPVSVRAEQGEADSRGLEGRGARLQLRAGRTASTRLQRALHPLPPVSPLAELFAVLSSTLGFKQDTASNWSK